MRAPRQNFIETLENQAQNPAVRAGSASFFKVHRPSVRDPHRAEPERCIGQSVKRLSPALRWTEASALALLAFPLDESCKRGCKANGSLVRIDRLVTERLEGENFKNE